MQNIEKIIFYNGWHNGDIFSGKGYINEIIKTIPEIKFYYSHFSHSKVIGDVAEYFHASELPNIPNLWYERMFVDSENKTIYINTWIGCYPEQLIPGELHANYTSLYKMWKIIYERLNSIFNKNVLQINEDVLSYIAETDFSKYEIDKAIEFSKQYPNRKLHLFCNGEVRSTQNFLGLMGEIIDQLSITFPDDIFICTAKFLTNRNNIKFTEDIFQIENDINEISFLSTFCNTIIGKNSGPYMFCHVKDNFNDRNKCFVSLSQRASDSYPVYNEGFDCNYIHLISNDDKQSAFHVINNAILIRSNAELDHHSRGKVLTIK